jgi:DNA-binding NarL/FixJ family response regulator
MVRRKSWAEGRWGNGRRHRRVGNAARTKAAIAAVDLNLPGMSGIEIIAKAHREYPLMKLVALTGQSSAEAMEFSLAAGACAHLVKSIAPEAFGPIMESLARQFRVGANFAALASRFATNAERQNLPPFLNAIGFHGFPSFHLAPKSPHARG